IRVFAVEQLEACGDAETARASHAAFFIALAERAETGFFSPAEAEEIARLAMEQGNLRAALTWLESRGEAGAFQRLAVALWWFWVAHGDLREGRAWLERAGAVSTGVSEASSVQALALVRAGTVALYSEDPAGAEVLLERGLAAAYEAGDTRVCAHANG